MKAETSKNLLTNRIYASMRCTRWIWAWGITRKPFIQRCVLWKHGERVVYWCCTKSRLLLSFLAPIAAPPSDMKSMYIHVGGRRKIGRSCQGVVSVYSGGKWSPSCALKRSGSDNSVELSLKCRKKFRYSVDGSWELSLVIGHWFCLLELFYSV